MNATARFYTGFVIAVALIVGIAFYAGYRTGFHAGATFARAAHHATVSPHATP